jgi:FKBP-type peptidyl-prolyl cis-trans isomerase FkpA
MKLQHLLLISSCVIALNACKAESPTTATASTATSSQDKAMTQAAIDPAKMTELQKIDTKMGTGREAEPGFNVSVHYTGWLFDAAAADKKGKKFDSSVDRGQPFEFALGAGQVIQGWDQGFAGMKIGGKRTLVIPSEMGYGARGAGGAIPPNATLIFDVELLDVK